MKEEPMPEPFAPAPQLSSAPPPPEPVTNAKPWSVDYYRFLFNVDTTQVLRRILKSVAPWPPNFFELISSNPDVYVFYL
jgi:hypothetical protein